MSALTPYSRDAMRGMKAEADEKNRLLRIQQIIEQIHTNAVKQAVATEDNKYKYAIPSPVILEPGYFPREISEQNDQAAFHKDNIDLIISGLEELFPGCSVKFVTITMAMGNDRVMYDVSDLDEEALALVNNPQKNSFIIIDWS